MLFKWFWTIFSLGVPEVSGMKIPEGIKSARTGEDADRAERNQKTRKSSLVNTVDKVELIQQGRAVLHTEKKCLKCQKFNHFAVVCRAGGKDKHQKSEQKQPKNKECKKHVKKTTEETASDNSTSSDDEFHSQAGRHLKHVRKIKSGDQAKTVTVQIAQTLESLRFSIRSH